MSVIDRAIELKAAGLKVAQIQQQITEEGFVTRKGTPLSVSYVASMISLNKTCELPDHRKLRNRLSDAHYRQKNSEYCKRYRVRHESAVKAYQRAYREHYLSSDETYKAERRIACRRARYIKEGISEGQEGRCATCLRYAPVVCTLCERDLKILEKS